MPTLVRTPDSSAEAGDGATGCAFGSHTCTGNMPAFAPKPNRMQIPAAKISFLYSDCSTASGRRSKARVPVLIFRSSSPMRRTRPPITAMNRYVYPARIASEVCSWMTQVKEVNDRISKKTNVVIRSAESMTPSVAPSVRRKKHMYLAMCSLSSEKYSSEKRPVPAHMTAVTIA